MAFSDNHQNTTLTGGNNSTEAAYNNSAQANYDSHTDERYERVFIYFASLCATMVVYILRTFGFYHMCLQISLRMHDLIFRAITRTAMLFFNTNPSGRILNRFSKDIRTLDVDVPRTLIDCSSVGLKISNFIGIF